MAKVYTFVRVTSGREYAYMPTNDPGSIHYQDIVDHEDVGWEEWELDGVEDDGDD
jgi:hypothetical protein